MVVKTPSSKIQNSLKLYTKISQATRLLTVKQNVVVPGGLPVADVMTTLGREAPRLRSEGTSAISRKRAPELFFVPTYQAPAWIRTTLLTGFDISQFSDFAKSLKSSRASKASTRYKVFLIVLAQSYHSQPLYFRALR